MDAPLERPGWLDPERLAELLDELRAAGFELGAAQYIAAQDLVLALAARGERLDRPELLAGYLGPVVCGSPEEQAEFGLLFADWAARFEPAATARAAPEPPDEEVESLRRRARWLAAAGLVLVLAAAAIGGLFFRQSEPLPGPMDEVETPEQAGGQIPARELGGRRTAAEEPADEEEWLAWWVSVESAAVASGLVLVLWWLWWRRRSRLFLERRQRREEPELAALWVRQLAGPLFAGLPLHHLAQRLRRRRPVPSLDLDGAATVERTLAAGGFPSPVYGTRLVSPEYLVLLDRRGRGDQQARFADELVDGLVQRDVYVERFYFDGDPRVCFPEDPLRSPVQLQELAGRYGEHRLLLFTDGDGLLDPVTGQASAAVEILCRWPVRALSTFEPRAFWGPRERRLGEWFLLVPAGLDGLRELIGTIHARRPEAVRETTAERRLPELLRRRPDRWLDRAEPEPAAVEELLWELGDYLGPPGMTWLAACAVYPSLDWNLTLYLGSRLEDGEGRPLLTEVTLARLVRLPWLRRGSAPDWLRRRLVADLPAEEENRVRAVLRTLFLTALEPRRAGDPKREFPLEYAGRHPHTLGRLLRPLLGRFSRRSDAESPLRDFVFLTFLAGRRRTDLALRLPRAVGRLLDRGTARPAGGWREAATQAIREARAAREARKARRRAVPPSPAPGPSRRRIRRVLRHPEVKGRFRTAMVAAMVAAVSGTGVTYLFSPEEGIFSALGVGVLSTIPGGIWGAIAGRAWRHRLPATLLWASAGAFTGLFLLWANQISELDTLWTVSVLTGLLTAMGGAAATGSWRQRIAGPGLGLTAAVVAGWVLGMSLDPAKWTAGNIPLFPLGALTGAIVARDPRARLFPTLLGSVLGAAITLASLFAALPGQDLGAEATGMISWVTGWAAVAGAICGRDWRGLLSSLAGGLAGAGFGIGLARAFAARDVTVWWALFFLPLGAVLGALLHAGYVWYRTTELPTEAGYPTKDTEAEAEGKPSRSRRRIRRGCLAGCAVVGIGLLTAILIPNFLDALEKARQKRTMSEMRNVGTAWMAWLTDQMAAAAAGQSAPAWDVTALPAVSAESLEEMLEPTYISDLPTEDAWGNPYEFRMNDDPMAERVFSIRSPGRDGVYSGDRYEPGSFGPFDYDADIVWADGYFVRSPATGAETDVK